MSGTAPVRERTAMSITPRLITFPPALDCEVARWILDRLGAPYEESRHSLLVVPLAIPWNGSKNTGLPVLFAGDETLVNIRAIVDWAAPRFPAGRALVPRSPALAAEVEKAWQDYSDDLGSDARDFGYYHLLRHPWLMVEPFTRGIPLLEKPIGWATFPLAAVYLWYRLSLSAERAQR